MSRFALLDHLALFMKTPLALISRRATICDSQLLCKIYTHTPTMDFVVRKHYFGCAEDESEVSFISEHSTNRNTSLVDEKCESSLLSNNGSCASSTPKSTSSSQSSSHTAACIDTVSQASDFVPGGFNNRLGRSLSMVDLKLNLESEFIDTAVVLSSNEEEYISEENVLRKQINNSVIYVDSDSDGSYQEDNLIKDSSVSKELIMQTETLHIVPVIKNFDFGEHILVKAEELHDKSQIENESNRVKAEDVIYIGSSDEDSELSYCEFNDTLKEMELALRNGLNYVMPNELNTDSDSKTVISALDSHEISSHPASHFKTNLASSVGINKITNIKLDNEKYKKTPISIRTGSCSTTQHKVRGCQVNAAQKQDHPFKFPAKLPGLRPTPDYQNVVSPVAAYIKSSSQVTQVQHVIPKPLAASFLFPKLTSSYVQTKKDDELPAPVYKPAKRTLMAQTAKVKLPGNIRKYISPVFDIVKHEGRIGRKEAEPAFVKGQLRSGDTRVSLDDTSDLNSSSLQVYDISLLTSKKAYIQ